MALVGKASASYWLGDNTTDRILDSFDAGGFEMPIALMVRGNSSIFRGRYEDGIASLHLAIANESGMSNLSYWNATLALGYYCLGDFGKALVTVTASQEFGTQYWLSHLVKIATLARLGRLEECPAAIAAYTAEYPGATASENDWMPFTDKAVLQDFLSVLREAGLPE